MLNKSIICFLYSKRLISALPLNETLNIRCLMMNSLGEAVSNVLYECALVGDDRCVIRALRVDGATRPPCIYGQSTVHHFDAHGRLVCCFKR